MAQIKNAGSDSRRAYGLISGSLGQDSLNEQIVSIQEFALSNGFEILELVDSVRSFDFTSVDFLNHLRIAKVQSFICWKLSNISIGDSSFDGLIRFISKIGEAKIQFISIDDKLDTELSTVKFLSQLISIWPKIKAERKSANGQISSVKAKNRNTKVGRHRVRDDLRISELRQAGLTIREVASEIGLSTTAVKRSLKESGDTKSRECRLQTEV